MRSNFHHLYADVLWYGVLAGSAIAFLTIYIARLGATEFQVSLLTAGPAVVNFAFSLPAGRWLESHQVLGASFWSALWHRCGYLLLIPLPWLLASESLVAAVVWITLLMSLPGTLLAISFNAAFADIVPPDWRGEVVGRRNALLAVSMTVTSLLCGWLLDQIVFPANYQVVFGLGAVGGMLSTYHIGKLRLDDVGIPARVNQPIGDPVRPGLMRFVDAFRLPVGLRFLTRQKGKPLLRLDLLRGSFGPFLIVYLFFYTFQYLPLPLFPLFIVRNLQLSDGVISLGNGIFYLSMLSISLGLGRLSARLGHRRLLAVSALLYSLYPLLIGLSRGPGLFLLASLVGGGVWALTSASLVNRLMEKTPEEERPAYMALHNLVLNLGVLAGSLAAPVLSTQLGLQPALLLGSGLRLLAGLLLVLWG
ncbi:MAG: MFS transporter [Anaerolineales bacterium]|nr:MFS transporter [Anaerolineales bacterium]